MQISKKKKRGKQNFPTVKKHSHLLRKDGKNQERRNPQRSFYFKYVNHPSIKVGKYCYFEQD